MKFRLKLWTFGVLLLAVTLIVVKLLLGFLPHLLVMTLEATGQFDHMLPESKLETLEIIQLHGYPAVSHSVTTPDGYVLEIHRIPHGSNNHHTSKLQKRHPVFLMHGFSCSSATWIINGVENSLGFVLADAGYDVFMGNLRGNIYTKHKTLQEDSDEFWQFAIDDHALLDLSTMIDFTLNVTGQEKLTFIGHSMGATAILFLLAEQKEFNTKIEHAFLQAPVIFNEYGKSLLVYLARNYQMSRVLWDIVFGGENYFTVGTSFRKLISLVCSYPKGIFFCNYFFSHVAGFNHQNLNPERLHAFIFHILHGTSRRVNLQFSQVDPPDYNLTSITARLTCFWGYMDAFTDVKDIERLKGVLPSTAIFEKIPIDVWNHFDFLLQHNATKYHYSRILEEMANYLN